jgi:hypothetical protein
MNREDIIRTAREACETTSWKPGLGNEHVVVFLERFFHLAYAAGTAGEREAIARIFDGPVWSYDYREIAAAIRARGNT